jgi:hypothetical protein
MLKLALYVFLWMYLLFLGFLIYAAVMQAWSRLKIGLKVLLAPVLLAVGGLDVAFNLVVGTVLFWERPKQFTFSHRCCQHLNDPTWRGHVAGAFSVPLNAIFPNHIHPVL